MLADPQRGLVRRRVLDPQRAIVRARDKFRAVENKRHGLGRHVRPVYYPVAPVRRMMRPLVGPGREQCGGGLEG